MAATELGTLPPLAGNQGRASDPERHIWLSASAGTGKTQVLAARVFRLLLRGTDPGAILCLTFTKAGAAEMAARVTGRLAHWVRADERELRADLASLGEKATPERIERARTLFARLLDAPGGGLRIQTIHSFCQTLLAAFPVEAGLVPGFRPLDAREEFVLAREALAELLVEAERDGRRGLIDDIGALSLRLGEGGAERFLRECSRAAAALDTLPSGIAPWLRRTLDLPSGDVESEIARCCGDAAFDVTTLRRLGAANRAWGAATGQSQAAAIEQWLASDGTMRAAQLSELLLLFRTKSGDPRKASAKLVEAEPGYVELADAVGGRCAELVAMRARAAYADLLARALAAGRDYARAYAAAKRRAGAVDFDDLIRAAVDLLGQPGMGEWVRYKLDQSTEHVLIDEAQDTNLDQWRIVDAVVEEFFTGDGARAAGTRTLFAVGDYKQAIFGFQGTDPLYFRWAYGRFLEKSRHHADFDTEARALEPLSLVHSFRTTRPVLEFVDRALDALPEPGLGAELETHVSRVAGPGSVSLWPIALSGNEDDGEEGWIGEPVREHAKRIACAIKGWIGALDLESKGRKLRAEDVMILVKRRGDLASLIVARLYAEGVPVAGVDRLRLNAPLAVQDLLAAVRFALQPDDDLNLAALLVSPLLGWSQDELMHAAPRGPVSLWRHLRDGQPPERLAPLEALLRRADFTTPYRFLEEILSGPLQGRRHLLLRLGEEARDPIDELLNAALNFESVATPSLQRFLDWFDRGDVEIVRDSAQPRDAVRVMTVHGAKGLQAPLVILADATADPKRTPRDLLRWKPEGEAGPVLPIFRPRKDEASGPLAAVLAEVDARELQEHWRLFYVAATRAEERLVVTGALGAQAGGEPPGLSWYALARTALTQLGVEGEGELIFRGSDPESPVAAIPGTRLDAIDRAPLPGWLHAPAPREARPPRPLAPSSLGEDLVADPPPTPAMRVAAERGRLLHALFERLPQVPADRRAAAGRRWLERSSGIEDAALRDALVDSALDVIEDSRFAGLFGADALAEAPVAAVVGEGLVVSGTVDRLVVTPDRVRIIDFKTGRRAPAGIEDIPPYHLRQMAAYVAALATIFPGRRVEAALLYTAGPRMFTLDDALLERHKPGFVPSEQSLGSSA